MTTAEIRRLGEAAIAKAQQVSALMERLAVLLDDRGGERRA